MFEHVRCTLILSDFLFPWQVVDEFVVKRFYLTLMLYDLWRQKSLWEVAEKFDQPRGFIQNLLSSTASFGACVYHFCQVTLVTLQIVLLIKAVRCPCRHAPLDTQNFHIYTENFYFFNLFIDLDFKVLALQLPPFKPNVPSLGEIQDIFC